MPADVAVASILASTGSLLIAVGWCLVLLRRLCRAIESVSQAPPEVAPPLVPRETPPPYHPEVPFVPNKAELWRAMNERRQ